MSEQPDRTEVQIAMRADLMRSDLEIGKVWFVNYAAIDPAGVKVSDLDLHGAAMLPEDVEKFAHRWLAYSKSVDINHDGIGRTVYVIESFFNSKDVGSPSWPINAHLARLDVSSSKEAMDGLRSGALNCVSLDAYTFNKVVRLPVAEARKAAGGIFGLPSTKAEWTDALATLGYPEVTGFQALGHGLFLATRKVGPPVAVALKDGELEASAAGGAWQHVAASILAMPTFTKMSFENVVASMKAGELPGGMVPQHGAPTFPIDWAPWSQASVNAMLAEHGVRPDNGQGTMLPQKLPAFIEGQSDQAVQEHIELTHQIKGLESPWAFVLQDGTGMLPHHTFRGGQMMVSRDGVIDALRKLDSGIFEGELASRKDAVRKHLMDHLDDIRLRSGMEAAS